MTTLDILDKKITELKNVIEQIKSSELNKKQQLEAELIILKIPEEVLLNEELIENHDFTQAISLLNKQNLNIEDIETIILQIQQTLEIRKKFYYLPELAELTEDQKKGLESLKENIIKAKEILKKEKERLESATGKTDEIKDLEDLKKILLGTGKRKYYTENMINTFFDRIDWENLSNEDFDEIVTAFYKTKNLQGKQNKKKENIDDVIALYKEYLDEKEFQKNEEGKTVGLFATLIYVYADEITSYIDLDNTREILEFFKEKGIIKNFGRPALLKVSLFANVEYVKKLYSKININYPEEFELYFEDQAATLWVCDSTNTRKQPFRSTRGQVESDESKQTLYSQCHSVTDEEFRANVKLLNDNAELFDDKYDISNFGAHLKAKTSSPSDLENFKTILKAVTSSPWAMIKNIEVFKTFKMGNIYKIPISSLELGDNENKLHLAIELGLLNPPMDKLFRELDKEINLNDRFLIANSQKQISNNTIRNYFQRSLSVLSQTSPDNFGYLFYKLEQMGIPAFYNYFFSNKKAGKRDGEGIKEDMGKNNFKEAADKKNFINTYFIIDFYNQYINDYNEYDTIISNYNDSNKVLYKENIKYYDEKILEESLIKKLEDNYRVTDYLKVGGEMKEIKNDFVYKFGDILISRYKVLRNAYILRETYETLTEDMIIASIVRNSFLSEKSFRYIEGYIKERNMKK